MSTEQHIVPSSIVTKAGVGVDGPGYLGGEAPEGRTTVGGVPVSADVDVFYELDTKDWQCVASTTSQPDGTWSIVGLNPDKKFNVVARHASFGGVIAVDVQPSRTDVVTLSGAFTANNNFNGVGGFMTIESGMPPFTASVVDPLPYGLNPLVVDGRKLIIDGTSDDAGLWESVVRVTDSNSLFADVPVSVEIRAEQDPHWSSVVSLLDFEDQSNPLKDETGRLWSSVGSAVVSSEQAAFGARSLKAPNTASLVSTPHSDDFDFGAGDFTIEFFLRPTATSQWATYIDKRPSGGYYSPFVIQRDNLSEVIRFAAAFNASSWGCIIHVVHPIVNEWSHVAFVRHSGVFKAFVRGVMLGSFDGGSTPLLANSSSVNLLSDGSNSYGAIGFLDAFRVTKGIARYVANFTPPDKPFPHQ